MPNRTNGSRHFVKHSESTADKVWELFGNLAQTAETIAMIPVLLALGATGAVLELRRLVQRGPDLPTDVQTLRDNEQRLKRVLQASDIRN